MIARPTMHSGPSVTAGYPGSSQGGRTVLRFLEAGLASWVFLLIALPLLAFNLIPTATLVQQHPQDHAHMLLEGFCGFVAIVLAVLLLVIAQRRRNLSILLFACAFLSMGVFDTLHALTDPFSHPRRFVIFHTTSTFLGAGFVLAGVVAEGVRDRQRWLAGDSRVWLAVGVLLVLAVALAYQTFMPPGIPADQTYFGFSPALHRAHYAAGVFYALSALGFYHYYRASGRPMALVVGSMMVLFSQSAYLFSFSAIWNLTWWLWHGVKVSFYLGIMVTVFISYLVSLSAIESSSLRLTRVNRKLASAQEATSRFNKALKIRNRMFQDAMSAFDLDHAMDSVSKSIHQLTGFSSRELLLRIPADEGGEFERRVRRLATRWVVHAQGPGMVCTGEHCAAVAGSQGALFECARRGEANQRSMCLLLSARGHEIGHLRLLAPEGLDSHRSLGQLGGLAVEAGTIIHNALLYHDWVDANAFRLALLRVSNLLSSTLQLDRVLESVCKESAALLESDGALVWLPNDQSGAFVLGAKWFDEHLGEPGAVTINAWCHDGEVCAKLLQGLDGKFRSRAIFWRDEPNLAALARPDGCPWEALALFPLHDEDRLIGVMVLMRHGPVAFSASTLNKGELLAGQVRIAIKNARSYERLESINHQLQVAEEHKLRAERLAVVGQMAASVAHEVRNPLSAISNCLSVLRTHGKEDPRGQAALEIIGDEVERLSTLTNNFLTYGKPQAGPRKPMVLENTLYRVGTALERHLAQDQSPITLDLDIPETATHLLFDSDGLETVLWNLLLNATQAIPGPGWIYVTMRARADRFLLVVADSGKGISADDRQRIFDPFYSQRSHGAGLGLAIVQRFVQEWGGRIRLSSTPGLGTVFFLSVPTANAPSQAWGEEV